MNRSSCRLVVDAAVTNEPSVKCGPDPPRGNGILGVVVPQLKCIGLCKQQTRQQLGAADLSAGAARRDTAGESAASE